MLTFTEGQRRFNYRVVGVALDRGRVLIHRSEHDPFWALPGGRCEFLESSPETLRREMWEETASEIEVGRLLWVVENFFSYSGFEYHELALYFLMQFRDDAPLRDEAQFVSREGPLTLLFRWLPLNELAAIDLRPTFLATRLLTLPLTPEHIVHREL